MGKLRVKQFEKYLDAKARYEIAEEIVREKVDKSLHLLTELSRFYDEIYIETIREAMRGELRNHEEAVKSANATYPASHGLSTASMGQYKASYKKPPRSRSGKHDLNKLLTYEGRVSIVYWDALSRVFNSLYPQFNYRGRKNKSYSWNMNASDEINALLNYGYAVLESQVRKYINTVGLDPAVGFLHELAPSKTPLVYDLQELYRWIVDLSVIQLLEEMKLKKSDFIVTDEYHVRLEEHTARMLIDKIKINFNARSPYKNKNVTNETILTDNIQQLANYIVDKNNALKFTIPKVDLSRNDDFELREFILNMRPEERRKLRINRSTLWYMRQNLLKGKKIKVYDKVKDKINV